jgi:hypothetical protein
MRHLATVTAVKRVTSPASEGLFAMATTRGRPRFGSGPTLRAERPTIWSAQAYRTIFSLFRLTLKFIARKRIRRCGGRASPKFLNAPLAFARVFQASWSAPSRGTLASCHSAVMVPSFLTTQYRSPRRCHFLRRFHLICCFMISLFSSVKLSHNSR